MTKEHLKEIARQAERDAEHDPTTVAARGIHFVRNYETKIISEIKKLKTIIEDTKDHEKSLSTEPLKDKIIRKMQQDIEIIKEFNAQVAGKTATYGFPITSNKIIDSIFLAQDFIEKNFYQLYDNEPISGYDFSKPETLNFIEYNEANIWGNAKAVQLQVALFYMATAITNQDRFSQIDFQLYSEEGNLHFADEAAIAHIEPLPNDFHSENFESCSWFFSDIKTPKGLLTIPAGYTFGGGRGSLRNPRGIKNSTKEQPTHDCSSLVGDMCKIEDLKEFTTLSQYIGHQLLIKNPPFIGKENLGREITENFVPTEKENLNYNTIYAHRVFSLEEAKDPFSSGTKGGHTSLVLGPPTNTGEIITLSTTRNIDTKKLDQVVATLESKIIGYGLEQRSLEEITRPDNTVVKPFFLDRINNNSR